MNRLSLKTKFVRAAFVCGMTLAMGLGVLLQFNVSNAATLTSIDVTPANPEIMAGQTQPFVAAGTFSDGSTRVLGNGTLSAGYNHTCAILSEGSVECWGLNANGQLGNESTSSTNKPAAVSGVNTATAVSAGAIHTCALLSGGMVKCWGLNANGQLGNASTISSTTPVAVSGIGTATAIIAGAYHTCALLSGGTVVCWGANSNGQLGNGSSTDSSVPVTVSGISTAVAISAGYLHSCALLSDGTVACWGANGNGQLGNGSTTGSTTPVEVSGISNATAISAGYYHSCALLSGGVAECWGANSNGQLGNGSTTGSTIPVTVSGISNATAISAGIFYTCALLSDSTVECWGRNVNGQLGDGSTISSATPVTVTGMSTAAAISAGANHTCALLSGGTVECWGANGNGQLGNGSSTDSSIPVTVSGMVSAFALVWNSSITGNATIGANGVATGLNTGTSTITAASGPVSGTAILTVIPAPPPSMTSITPSSGLVGTSVAIAGSNFGAKQGTSIVSFNGTSAGTADLWTPSQILVKVPIGATTGPVVVTVNGLASNSVNFSVINPPSIISVTPSTTLVGAQVIISGVNFGSSQGTSTVTFKGMNAGNATSWSPAQITVNVPPGATTGPVVVTVNGFHSNSVTLTVKPVITSITPNSGSIGSLVTLNGSGFGTTQGANFVTFNGISAGTASVWSSAQVLVKVPVGATTGPVAMTVNSVVSNTFSFSITPPSLTSISVAPLKPLITIGTTRQFTATGNYSDGSKQNLTTTVTWGSSNSAVATISNTSGTKGLAPAVATGTTTVSATLGSASGSTTLTVTTEKPDLIVADISGSLSGTNLYVSDTEQNSGKSDAGAFGVDFYLSATTAPNPATDKKVGTRNLSGLAVGATLSATTKFTIPPTMPIGNYYLCAISDSGSSVTELNEANNTKCTAHTYAVSPDLRVYSVSGTLSGVSLYASDTEINSGNKPAGAFTVSYYLSAGTINPASGTRIGTRNLISGLAGGSATNSATTRFSIPAAMPNGNYHLCAISDSGSSVAELNEANNTTCTDDTYAVSPDLRVYTLSGTLSGVSLYASDTEINSGNKPAGTFTVSYYLSAGTINPASGTRIGTRSLISGLAGGSATNSAATRFSIPAAMPNGNYYLCAISDSGSSVAELNEANNTTCTADPYKIGPDLLIYGLSASLSGTTFHVSDTEQNIGNQPAEAFAVSYFLSKDKVHDTGDISLGSRPISSLAGGFGSNSATRTLALPSGTPAGSYYIIAVTDLENAVAETNEGNNTKATSVAFTIP